MTIGLQITDGTTTVDLNDGSYYEVMEFDLGAADISALSVVGSVRLYIDGTKSQIQTELAALQKLLQSAVDTAGTSAGGALYSGLDKRVYLNYRTDGTETYYRSELIRISYRLEADSIEVLNFDCGGVVVVVDFERRNWWEGAETQVPLSNHLFTNETGFVTVNNPQVYYRATDGLQFVNATSKIIDTDNGLADFLTGDTITVVGSTNNDGKFTVATGGVAGEIVTVEALTDEAPGADIIVIGAYNNYIDIDGDDITGDLPAATRLEFIHAYAIEADSRLIQYVWIGQHYHASPSAFQHIYEGEDSTDGVGTDTEDGEAASGEYRTWTVADATETLLTSYTISAAQIINAAGRYYKLIVRFYSDDAPITSGYFRFRLQLIKNSVTIWSSSWVKPEATPDLNIRDLLIFQLPPQLAGLGSGLGTMILALYGYQDSGSSQDLDIDFLQITPVDGFNFLYLLGGTDIDSGIVVDGIQDYIYRVQTTGRPNHTFSDISPYATMTGQYLMLQPGRDQRIYFLTHTSTAGISRIEFESDVLLYYRPRRLTI